MEHERQRLPGAPLLFQAFTVYVHNEPVAACRPCYSREAPDVVPSLVFHLVENSEEVIGDINLVTYVKPYPRRMDVALLVSDQVPHRAHLLFNVVGSTPRSGPSTYQLAVPPLHGLKPPEHIHLQ